MPSGPQIWAFAQASRSCLRRSRGPAEDPVAEVGVLDARPGRVLERGVEHERPDRVEVVRVRLLVVDGQPGRVAEQVADRDPALAVGGELGQVVRDGVGRARSCPPRTSSMAIVAVASTLVFDSRSKRVSVVVASVAAGEPDAERALADHDPVPGDQGDRAGIAAVGGAARDAGEDVLEPRRSRHGTRGCRRRACAHGSTTVAVAGASAPRRGPAGASASPSAAAPVICANARRLMRVPVAPCDLLSCRMIITAWLACEGSGVIRTVHTGNRGVWELGLVLTGRRAAVRTTSEAHLGRPRAREDRQLMVDDAPVLVAGATGFIGLILVPRLARGRSPRARARAPSRSRREWGGDTVPGDVTDRESLVRAAEGVSTSSTSRASSPISRPSARAWRRQRTAAPQNVLAAAARHGVQARRPRLERRVRRHGRAARPAARRGSPFPERARRYPYVATKRAGEEVAMRRPRPARTSSSRVRRS